MAHGAFFAIGAYTAWVTATVLEISFWSSLILAPIVVGAVGYIVEVTVVKRLYEEPMKSILATWGIYLMFTELIKITAGSQNKTVENPLQGSIDIGIATFPSYRIFLIFFSIAVVAIVFIILDQTNTGIRIRAVMQDKEAAPLLGVNRKQTYRYTFVGGTALAGLAGAAVAPIVAVSPNMGVTYLVDSFLAIILGGTNVLVGIVPGSAVVAGLSNYLTFSINPVQAQLLVYVLVIGLIIIRPRGLLGNKDD